MTSTMDNNTEDIWRQARARAATLGAFHPSQLLDPDREDQLAALDRLAGECVEVLDEGSARWMLNPDARTKALAETPREKLNAAMNAVQPSRDDRLGQLLRGVLSGQAVVDRTLGMQDLGLLRTALQFASTTRDTKETLQQVDRLLAERDSHEAMRSLLPSPLVGRQGQLTKLRRFVQEPAPTSAEDIMWITGAGGSGKSALLASFGDELRRSHTCVLHIDFDRPAMFNGSLTTLMMELSRQLEVAFPDLAESLSEYRRAVRSGRSVPANPSSFDEAQVKTHRSYSAWHDCMGHHLPIAGDIVLILDTAEEVGLSSEFDLDALRRWLRELRTRDGLKKLKAVLCGRAFDEDQLALVRRSHRIELDDLPPAAAVELLEMFLQREGVAGGLPLDDLVDMLGGNPLVLKILAAYLADGGANVARDLLDDRGHFDRQFAQSFLYKRILSRLRDASEELKSLAHPGLVLRRVTPHLIQHVLAGPCNLGELDEQRARALFTLLAGQVWLVQRTTNPDAVVHRRDLRRLMLQAMTAEDGATAVAIHTAAATYYLERMDPVLSRQDQLVEGQYHSLFIPGAAPPNPDTLAAFARALGEDLESLPVPVRAGIKLQLGRKLTVTETRALSGSEQALYRSEQVRKEVRLSGVSVGAVASSLQPSAASGDTRVAVSEVHAAFEQGDLDQVARGTAGAIADFADVVARAHTKLSSEDFTQSAVWRCAIATLSRDPDPLLNALLGMLRNSRVREGMVNGPWLGRLLPVDAYRMLFRIHGADCPPDFMPWAGAEIPSRMSATQELRHFQLLDKREDETAQVPTRLLRDLAPRFTAYFGGTPQGMQLDREGRSDLKQQSDLRARGTPVTLNVLERLQGGESCVVIRTMEKVGADVKDILVGRIPEIYPLARAAARACTQRSLVAFTDAAAREHALWPIELAPDHFKRMLALQREEWTSTLISCADRFGLLRQLVDWMEDRNRLARRPRQLLRTVRDYELRLRQFI
ncbi:ATP-binding protein [Delftia tsuruhatensis]|uniref:ATP-binding protein n=1 Tax=Delftia tsuruhatensis TaxID=180282 RepID=UPI0020915449|nr:ATP-binding protein [Delftia tsuruhatensis]MCO5335664.1 ATP-binding protein [Delftia tsuruhatensis]MCR4544368.1 ATP-binding protein [Delftia tsuruhatensis]